MKSECEEECAKRAETEQLKAQALLALGLPAAASARA